ncbi:hypothetical protein BHM03_00030923 [Ensete ventricosum]|nr:hypothetical protein BHM03_00030923 [Ensete ventricosum]
MITWLACPNCFQIWSLWKEGKVSELVDESIGHSCSLAEVLRCITVGLLCVQERPQDRPTMSSVVLMLSSDGELPQPQQPGFVVARAPPPPPPPETGSATTNHDSSSTRNSLSVTLLEGRYFSGVGTSGGLLWEPLGSVYAEEDLHKEDPLLVLPGGSFILTGRKVNRSLDLTSAITSAVVASYIESVGAEAWRQGVACHASFMVCGGSSAGAPFDQFHLGYRRGFGAGTGPSLTRILTWLLTWWGNLFDDVTEMHGADELVEIHYPYEN